MTAPKTRQAVVTTDVFGNNLTLNFSTGAELTLDITKLSPEIAHQAMLHGLKQKLVDAAAIARSKENGISATAEDKYEAVKTVFDRITGANGQAPLWNAVREGVEKAQGGIFIRAMMEVSGKTRAQIDNALEKYTKEQIAALKKNPRIMDVMHRLEREALANRTDNSDDLLAQLAGDGSDESSDDAPAPTPKKAKGK